MAEATQYKFEMQELAAALIEHQGLKTGKWMVSIDFTLAGGVVGSSKEDSRPAAILQVRSVQLVAAPEDAVENISHLVVDAAQVGGRSGTGAVK